MPKPTFGANIRGAQSMHLHGHFFRVLQGAGEYCPVKHTVNVAPVETVRIELTADNPGNWFFHCHNAYHLEAGTARQLQYVTCIPPDRQGIEQDTTGRYLPESGQISCLSRPSMIVCLHGRADWVS